MATTRSRGTSETAARQRRLQRAAEAKAAKSESSKHSKPRPKQAGARPQPRSPMPAQHLRKPGRESELDLAPRFLAPDYRGSGKLEGRVALITGGDSGIGRAVAVLFAREGADVAIVYLDEHDDAKTTCRHVEEEGGRSLALPGDVRDAKFCERAVAQTLARFGRLDVLVNNAAFQQHVAQIQDISDTQFDETMRTNVYGYFNMARAAVPHMAAGASIINNGSVTGLFGSPELLDYATTKGAIHAFTKSLASNLVAKGIRVNAVAPGPVWTPLNPADRAAEDVAEFGAKNPMGRPAQPEELSPAFVFLAAPVCSSYVTGAILPVMGGPKG
jgi:NAD(P)-dependent dehydrogenase (short-subunit alcohol dehydrogenase family)